MNFPSVTSVISPWADFSAIRPEVLENAARRGTDVHRICSALALGLWVPSIPDDCAGFVLSFEQWIPVVQDVIMAEDELVDPSMGFLGHPDLIVRIKGDRGLTMVDLKTPATTNKAWRLQLAAYRRLAEVNGFEISRVLSLRLRKDGGRPIVNEYTGTYQEDLAVFLAALTCWKFFNPEN